MSSSTRTRRFRSPTRPTTSSTQSGADLAMMRIPVGETFTIVDDDDYEEASQYIWTLVEWRGKQYAKRKVKVAPYTYITESLHFWLTGWAYVDHIDGDGLNNQRSNLREVTHKKNLQYQKPQNRKKSSAYRGIAWFKPREKWRARLKCNGIEVHIGYFDNEHDAAEAWNKKALEYYGPESFQNVIERKEVVSNEDPPDLAR